MQIDPCNFADQNELAAIHALMLASYTVEAKLINCWTIPALHESPSDLLASKEKFLGCYLDNTADQPRHCVGIIATEPEPNRPAFLRISRLAVDPAHFGQGIARRLLTAVIAASDAATTSLIVSTGAANTPARRLYQSAHFQLTRTFMTPDNVTPLVEYTRPLLGPSEVRA